nr:MAG TPA: hypothetical protein [Caudoviricetes sp.]
MTKREARGFMDCFVADAPRNDEAGKKGEEK